MTRALYYASTVRNLKDVIQYFIYPVAKGAGFLLFGNNPNRANLFANLVGSVAYAGITTDWFGKEAKAFDVNCRLAVCAELGIDPKDFKFSDYYDSHNAIVAKERHDLISINRTRYLTDAAFLLPALAVFMRGCLPAAMQGILPSSEQMFGEDKAAESFWDGMKTVRMADWVYAGKSAYWGWETFFKAKTAHYSIIKLQEVFDGYHTDIKFNDVLMIYQNTLVDNGKKPLSSAQIESVRPLLVEVQKLCNKDKDNAVENIVYLFGMGKVNVLDAAGDISAAAIAESRANIEKVAAVGLKGIIAENKMRRPHTQAHGAKSVGVAEHLKRGVTDTLYNFYNAVRGAGPDFNARVSNRDPTEVRIGP